MKAAEMRELTVEELNSKLKSLKEELFNLRFQHAINQLDNPMRIHAVKKDIARIKTTLRQMEIQDAGEYIPDPAQEADAQLDQVKKQLAASLAEDPEQAEKHEKEAPKAETKPEDDDFEVFDLDDEL